MPLLKWRFLWGEASYGAEHNWHGEISVRQYLEYNYRDILSRVKASNNDNRYIIVPSTK